MPLLGGPSDKAGNSYERRWTVRAMLDLLDGQARDLRIEVPGPDGAGYEFRRLVDGVPEWHQAKRQRAAGPWTISALKTEQVIQPWRATLERGEHCVFVSSTSADDLRELTDRARSAESWEEFDRHFLTAAKRREAFEDVRRAWNHPLEAHVYDALQRIWVHTISENVLSQWNTDRLRALVTGCEPATAAAALSQLADDAVHHTLNAEHVWAHLAQHGIAPRQLDGDAKLVT